MHEDADVSLFVEQAIWATPHLTDSTRRGVLNWTLQFLEDDSLDVLAKHFQLNHPIQLAAENAVISLLGRRLRTYRDTRRRSHRPERNVDWPATIVANHPSVPCEYEHRVRNKVIDDETVAALATIARTWARLLELGGVATRDRRERLLQAAQVGRMFRTQPYLRRHESRLSRMDDVAKRQVDRIRAARRLLLDTFGKEDEQAYRNLAMTLGSGVFANLNTLLELTSTLSIARAASMIDAPDGSSWRVEFEDRPNGSAIRLRSATMHCRVYKGIPGDVGRRGEDKLNASIRAMGLSVRGNQPDLVLEFAFTQCPHRRHYVLGDAKRNRKGNGEPYLRESIETAAVYAVSYGHLMGLRFGATDPFGFTAHVHPAVTLFCLQGPEHVGGAPSSEAHRTLATRDELPPIIALGLQHLAGPESGPWRSPTLEAWFGRIAREAARTLRSSEPQPCP